MLQSVCARDLAFRSCRTRHSEVDVYFNAMENKIKSDRRGREGVSDAGIGSAWCGVCDEHSESRMRRALVDDVVSVTSATICIINLVVLNFFFLLSFFFLFSPFSFLSLLLL